MSVVSTRKNWVNILGITSSFLGDIDDTNKDNDDDNFNFYETLVMSQIAEC